MVSLKQNSQPKRQYNQQSENHMSNKLKLLKSHEQFLEYRSFKIRFQELKQ